MSFLLLILYVQHLIKRIYCPVIELIILLFHIFYFPPPQAYPQAFILRYSPPSGLPPRRTPPGVPPGLHPQVFTPLPQAFHPDVHPDNYIIFLYNINLILKNMCTFKDCRRLCSYISVYLNARKLPKIAKLGHGRCFLQSILR